MSDPVTRLNEALEGRYHIERELGEGGMATVYLAKDLKHNRHVALKVLKPELAAVVGAERFLAEIETTANLQHPHILPLYDSGEADSFLFYVMPFVEGESLRERLDREKQLPVDEAVRIVSAVSGALDYAHRHGVVHRDIKPANVLLQDDQPVVADFGIALAVGAAGGARLTETGLSVGTPYYMSPEQATGDQHVGPASDIYAAAAVLYELLTGEPPYMGTTAQAVLGKILQGDPVSATALRRSVPTNVDAAIRRGLEKLPADRFGSAQQFSNALADPVFRHGTAEQASVGVGERRWRTIALTASALAVLGFTLAGLGRTGGSTGAGPGESDRIPIPAFGDDLLRPIARHSALAPDGSSMVFGESADGGGTWQLWLKPRSSEAARPLPGTEQAQNVIYSPDSQWIAFVAEGELKKLRLVDGFVVTMASDLAGGNMIAVAWLDDGSIVYELPTNVLMRIPDTGSEAPDTLVDYGGHGFGQLAVLVTICRQVQGGCGSDMSLAVYDVAADSTRQLLKDVARGWYLQPGRLLYVNRAGAVFIAPFDLDALRLTGPGVPLFDDVAVAISAPEMAVSAAGNMLYARASSARRVRIRRFVWVERDGAVTPVAAPAAAYGDASLALDGTRLVTSIYESEQRTNLWIWRLPDGPSVRLTTGEEWARRPIWLSDSRIGYVVTGTAGGIRALPADGSSGGAFDQVAQPPSVFEFAPVPNSNVAVIRRGSPDAARSDIGTVDLETGDIADLVASEFDEYAVNVSPDGRWIAYVSNATGAQQVVVRPFPGADAQIPVSGQGSLSPVWARNGRELFYIDGDGWLVSAEYEGDPAFEITNRTSLFDTGRFTWEDFGWRVFDVSPDDQRFLFRELAQDEDDEPGAEFVLWLNFVAEVEALVGG
jgi:serine/threonine-protein kinase